jgi:hypothetical protein
MSPAGANRRQCPNCRVTLTRYEWSRFWWMAAKMSGRLVQPCGECGARLRLSAMAVLTTVSAIGLMVTAVIYVLNRDTYLLLIAMILLLLMLVAMMATRLEVLPSTTLPKDAVPPPRHEHPRI